MNVQQLIEQELVHWGISNLYRDKVAANIRTAFVKAGLKVVPAECVSALREQVDACMCPDCEMCYRHEEILAKLDAQQ